MTSLYCLQQPGSNITPFRTGQLEIRSAHSSAFSDADTHHLRHMISQVAMTAAATPHNSKPSAMQSHLNKLLLLVPTTLLQLASASYGVLRSAASAPQLLDSCIADTVGPKFDFDKLNDECNELLLGNDSFNASRADLVAGAAAVALPQLHIRLPTAAESAAAEAEALLAPGTPPQQ